MTSTTTMSRDEARATFAELRAVDGLVDDAVLDAFSERLAALLDGPDERVDAARAQWRTELAAAASFVARPHRHSTGGDHAGVITAADIAGFAAGYLDVAQIRLEREVLL